MRRLAAVLGSVIAGAVIGLGCSHPGVFRCESSGQCQDGERQGVCTDAGFCAFPEESCASGLEYGALADPEVAGTCVPEDGTGTSDEPGSDSTTTTTTTTTSSSEGTPVTSDETGPDGVCPQGLGGACEPEDPCALAGVCDPDGVCVPTEVVTCNAPGPCESLPGECQPDGGCTYQTVPPGVECQDGDPCTLGDWCDDAANCVPGQACPQGECETAECTEEGCVYSARPDGASCGEVSALRCCGGECVDISSDPLNCGGCNAECSMGQECESVEITEMCLDNPADTSGRCRCDMADDQCPLGQLCSTQVPYDGRCEPSDAMGCDGVFVQLKICPNYCSY